MHSYAQQEGMKYDNKAGSSMMPIIYELDTLVNIIENDFKAEIVRMEFDIIRDTAISYRNMFPGYRYGIFVYGDYRIKELNLSVFQKNGAKWENISTGTIDKNTSLAWVEPKRPGLFTIKVYVNEFYGEFNGGHYGILIFH